MLGAVRWLERACRIWIYDLRSTFATRLSAGGVSDEWVTQLLRQGDAKAQLELTMRNRRLVGVCQSLRIKNLNGGRGRTRTCGLLRVKQAARFCRVEVSRTLDPMLLAEKWLSGRKQRFAKPPCGANLYGGVRNVSVFRPVQLGFPFSPAFPRRISIAAVST